jgi:hypothetical protein
MADTAVAVIAELGHDNAVEPDDDHGTVLLMHEHDRPNHRLRAHAVVRVLAALGVPRRLPEGFALRSNCSSSTAAGSTAPTSSRPRW